MKVIITLSFLLMFSALPTSKTFEIYSSAAVMSNVVQYLNKMTFVTYLEDMITSRKLWLTRLFDVIGKIEIEEYSVHSSNFSAEFPADSVKFILEQAYVSYGINDFVRDVNLMSLSEYDLHGHTSMMPNRTDVYGSITGLHRLEEVYNLTASNMSQGKIIANHTRPLSTLEIFTIANSSFSEKYRLNSKQYHIVKEWINLAEQSNNNETVPIISQKELSYLKLKTLNKAGCMCTRDIDILYEQTNLSRKLKLLKNRHCKRKSLHTCQELIKYKKVREPLEDVNFRKLCKGDEIVFSEKLRHIYQSPHELRCRLVDNGNPILLLQPIKAEEVRTRKPIIYKLHDVLGEKEIKFFKERAMPDLERGTLLRHDGKVTTSHTKVSQQTFLPKHTYDKTVDNLRGRLAALTNLNIGGFEKIQVANYAGGGYYNTHVDANFVLTEKPENYLGKMNRIVSMVMYISDVESGGATVFPVVGASIQPEKGGVALFYNLHRSTKMNPLSKHGGCPIILGEKWIATQWVTTFHQEFAYSCTLDEND